MNYDNKLICVQSFLFDNSVKQNDGEKLCEYFKYQHYLGLFVLTMLII